MIIASVIFLQLLHSGRKKKIAIKYFKPIDIEDEIKTTKRDKMRSVLSVFFQITCVAHKQGVNNEDFIAVLLQLYNCELAIRIILDRQYCMLCTTIEKGKGEMLDDLRVIELLEYNLQIIL